MKVAVTSQLNTNFSKDVIEGLSSFPKFLYSKYIYDEAGDKLFQDIMALPEYYLTEAEYNIFSKNAPEIGLEFNDNSEGFDIIELGAGDGKKTKVLLRHFLDQDYDFTYKPIDISQHSIDQLSNSLRNEYPSLDVQPEQGEYFEVLERIKNYSSRKKVIMFLGSNIGNLLHPRAIDFLTRLQESMSPKDMLFIGMDQKKDPQQILDAYNDPQGVTAAFNLNLLKRINREFDGNFNLEAFSHWEVYDPETGTAKSYLISREEQEVTLQKLNLTVTFNAWESIHTEISQKYDDKVVRWLADESGLEIKTSFSDEKKLFKNYLMIKK